MFENSYNEITFILNDLIDYFHIDEDTTELDNFIEDLLRWYNSPNKPSNTFIAPVVEFNCKNCTKTIDGVTNYIHMSKKHKGKLNGYGYGFDYRNKRISLSFNLKRIKYTHEVDTTSPITFYGELPIKVKNIIKEINIKRDSEKYNL